MLQVNAMAKICNCLGQKFTKSNILAVLAVANVMVFAQLSPVAAKAVAQRRGHKRMVIHVPVQVKMHHHTHTVYTHTRDDQMKETVYKMLSTSSYDKGKQQLRSGSGGKEFGSHGTKNHHNFHPAPNILFRNNYDDESEYDEPQPKPLRSRHHRGRHTGHTNSQYRQRKTHADRPAYGQDEKIFDHSPRGNAVEPDYPDIEAFVDDISWVDS